TVQTAAAYIQAVAPAPQHERQILARQETGSHHAQVSFEVVNRFVGTGPGHPGHEIVERLLNSRVNSSGVARFWGADQQPLRLKMVGEFEQDRVRMTGHSV